MKTIYTAIFGDYDDLKEPTIKKARGWNYVCFTDQDLISDTWEIRKVPLINNDPVKTARYYKIMFHKVIETELSIWIDATFIINTNLNKWWQQRFRAPFTAIQHPFDNCIYKDAESCISVGKGDRKLIERQVELYKVINVPKNNGLIASGVLMRQRVSSVNVFCNTWWLQVQSWSERDQIAYGYANWKHPNVVQIINWDYTVQKEFIHIPHIGKPWRNEKLKEAYASNQR